MCANSFSNSELSILHDKKLTHYPQLQTDFGGTRNVLSYKLTISNKSDHSQNYMKKFFSKLNSIIDRIAGKIVGEKTEPQPSDSQNSHSASNQQQPAQKTSSSQNNKTDLRKNLDPDLNPFESAPNMEEVITEDREKKRQSGKLPKNYLTRRKNTEQVVGLKKRKSGDAPEQNKIVQNEANDTVYSERNEIVKTVYDKYAKYGDKVASAVLSKSFLPNGLQIILSKLEIESLGRPLMDHDQIVDWIDEHGVEEFCQRMKIKIS